MAVAAPALVMLLVGVLLLLPAPSRPASASPSEDSSGEMELLRGEDIPDREANKCCRRETKMKSVGLSVATGEEITVDIGQCKKHCTRNKLKKDEFERLIQENPDIDPRTLFEMHRRRRAEPSCLGDEVCAPSAARMERVLTLEGSVSVSVTDECACQPRSHSCRRRPHRVTLHNDTPLQTTVDIGDCHGHCAHELGCKPIKTRTVTVEGPNGSECLTVVEQCGCEAACYRALHFQQVYNYTDPDEPTVEMIDVGKCVGDCDSAPEETCVWRELNGSCGMALSRASRCSASGVREIEVWQRDGSTRTLMAITHCGCH
ncbi:uncharacterized protein LOC134765920 [Penaeus indicus]|uniref:uncharacterized protein LOC134765920 n=1 Tax=Penaeus indicus TaxID=29960 RepID=UPI00300D05D7